MYKSFFALSAIIAALAVSPSSAAIAPTDTGHSTGRAAVQTQGPAIAPGAYEIVQLAGCRRLGRSAGAARNDWVCWDDTEGGSGALPPGPIPPSGNSWGGGGRVLDELPATGPMGNDDMSGVCQNIAISGQGSAAAIQMCRQLGWIF